MKYLIRFFPLITFAAISFTFYILSPQGVVSLIGIENAYVLIFVLALFGGMTTFSGIPYHFVLIALAAGGLNPYVLGTTTAIAVSLGDCTSYFLGYYGRELIPEKIQRALQRLTHVNEKYPRVLPLIFFLYGALIPFSSDLLTIPMGFLRHPLWRVMIPLALGTMLFNIGLALMATHAYEWIAFLV